MITMYSKIKGNMLLYKTGPRDKVIMFVVQIPNKFASNQMTKNQLNHSEPSPEGANFAVQNVTNSQLKPNWQEEDQIVVHGKLWNMLLNVFIVLVLLSLLQGPQ